MSGIQPLPLLHVSLKPVLGLAAPICVGSSEILWHFGIIIVEWAHVWGWKESGLREPQCRFWRTEWRSQRSSGCLSSPFFPRQQCPPSNTMPALCQQLPCVRAGGICCRNGPSLSPPAPKNDEVGPFCCCWQSAMLGKRPCSKQALLSWAFPPH